MKDFFKSLDLDNQEFIVYKALLRLGVSSIRQIAEDSRINRGTTHEILKKLLKKGLASYRLSGKRRHYLAESPEKLNQIIKEKRVVLEKVFKLLNKEVIPDLKNQQPISAKPNVRYYEGDEGIEQVLKDVLAVMRKQEKRKYFVFSAKPIRKYLYLFFPAFTKNRVKNKINVDVIALGGGGESALLSRRKWLPIKSGDFFASYIIIYADKLALISLTKEELPYAVIIEEKGISKTMKLIFTSLWSLL